jgi:nucleoside-diphosphate-sugar epimerase
VADGTTLELALAFGVDMNIAITGATGFIGRRLVREHMRRGDKVRILTRRPSSATAEFGSAVETCAGDLAKEVPGAFLEGVDVLYHCAAELTDPLRMIDVNVDGTKRLLEVARRRIRRWVQLSSVGVYGPRGAGLVTEEVLLNPHNAYERSKTESDRLVAAAAASGCFELAVLRPSNVFGPDMPNRSLYQLAAMIRRGWFFFIGPPGSSANYVHVDNVVQALVLCATCPAAAGRIYNLSDFRTIEAFVASIADDLGVPFPRLRVPTVLARGGARLSQLLVGGPLTTARVNVLICRAQYPIDRIERELGYRHAVTMEDGLAQTVKAFFPDVPSIVP